VDQCTAPGLDGEGRRSAHRDLAGEVQVGRQGITGAVRITGANGIAIDRGTLELGQRVRRANVFGEDTIQRGGNIHRFGFNARLREMREEQAARLVGRQESEEFGHWLVIGRLVDW
jgi:hypothetical protein